MESSSSGSLDLVAFEREMHGHYNHNHHNHDDDDDDDNHALEAQIADALTREGKNDRMSTISMHLRLKHGANARPRAMSRRELADLVEMFASSEAASTIISRLANFYARIAIMRARIVKINSTISGMDLANCGVDINAIHSKNGNMDRLLALYTKNEENRREKQNTNQRELARIMESAIHPDLTEHDLRALEIQVDHIVERGFSAEEMRRLQIIEAVLEQNRLDELLDELKRETRGSPR